MNKPTIFYFVHAYGNGHRATFNLLYPALSRFFEVIAMTTNSQVSRYLKDKHNVQILELPPKYRADYVIPEHTYSKAFEVTPYAIEPAVRVQAIAEAVQHYSPKALYCDGVPELGIVCRGMGLPVVLVHLPGNKMKDPTQVFAYELADHIVAHFPDSLEQEDYRFANKTFYSGYMSKYSRRDFREERRSQIDDISILLGYDNYDEAVLRNITADKNTSFTIIGNKRGYQLDSNCKMLGPVDDIIHAIPGEIVISAAGQNSIAELLSLNKKMILLPEPRPYDEQSVHAKVLAGKHVALLAENAFNVEQWQQIIQEAKINTFFKNEFVNKRAPETIAEKMKYWYA